MEPSPAVLPAAHATPVLERMTWLDFLRECVLCLRRADPQLAQRPPDT